ncbi:MAG TPA: glycosyltransferase [Solirubrobacterales bacterium]|jgi:glycosyltransferase involved in cell wall biosynthesis
MAAGRARAAVAALAAERARRRCRPPALKVAERGGEDRTVYYLCPDHASPSGGVRAIYRHVDLLNEAGIDAAVLHHRRGFSCRWFEHSTRVLAASGVELSPRDLLVVPEIYGPFFDRLPEGPRLVAFNQNAYLTFDRLAPRQELSYRRFEAAMTVSRDSAEYLRFAFPELDVAVVPNSIDSELFRPCRGLPPRRLATMPRKRAGEADQIVRLLGARLDGWEVVEIEGRPEAEVAARLRESPIFLALGRQEGFGLPAAEAMASGCFVVGFPGFGGRELFDPQCSGPVEDGDVLGAAVRIANAIELYESRPAELREAGMRARRRIVEVWTPEEQRRALLDFFAGLLGTPAASLAAPDPLLVESK